MSPPRVSVIVPCYNEARTIELLLDALAAQTFPQSELETIIADGMSTDQTRQRIADFLSRRPDVNLRIVDNPARNIPAALNRAIAACRGEFIVRLDAHAVPAPDYIGRCVAALESGLGENVGGIWQIAPGAPGWAARSIAEAAAHPLGVGDAKYRHTTRAGHVDTVPFGAFRRSLVERIGGFDESLHTNEDYEFNVRVRQSGGRIWLDPAIRTTYFARATFGSLARQYLRYGFWKGRMLRRYPRTVRWRQLLPPLFVAGLTGGGLLAVFWSPARLPVLGVLLVYLAALWIAALPLALRKRDPALLAGIPLAIATMHLCWGAALLWSLVKRP